MDDERYFEDEKGRQPKTFICKLGDYNIGHTQRTGMERNTPQMKDLHHLELIDIIAIKMRADR